MPSRHRHHKSSKATYKSQPLLPVNAWRPSRYLIAVLSLALALACYFFAKLHRLSPTDDGDKFAVSFAIVDLVGKGKGAVALRDIQQGELLIREKPLFVVPHQISSSPTALISSLLGQLTQPERDAFYNLSFVNFPNELSPEDNIPELALAIFQTNAVAAGNGGVGLFPRMARLNHGCSRAFNVMYSWRGSEGVLVVHALKSIKKGEELLTCYTNSKRPRDERREFLAQHYGFNCTCEVCSLPEEQSRQSDKRLTTISELYGQLGSWSRAEIDGKQAIDIVNEIWALGEKEGYWSERGRLAADAVWIGAAHSDASAASSWARLAIEWYAYELGADSPEAIGMQDLILQPRLHSAWGTRDKTSVGGPRFI